MKNDQAASSSVSDDTALHKSNYSQITDKKYQDQQDERKKAAREVQIDDASDKPEIRAEADELHKGEEGGIEAPAHLEVSTTELIPKDKAPIPPTKDDIYIQKQTDDIAKATTDGKLPQKDTESGSEDEIQSIIEQFGDNAGLDVTEESTSQSGNTLPVFHYPPRKSSLQQPSIAADPNRLTADTKDGQSASKDDGAPVASSTREPERASLYASSVTSQPPPPSPDPEPDLPFDFQRFLEQLRHRTADPVARFLRSFLMEFGKKQWQVHEQVKIISDFLAFISNRMAQCDVWRTVSDAEFDNAREGMEKLVMNRLYTQTFSPEIPLSEVSSTKGKRKGSATPLTPGRKGQHLEDTERDEVLAQKVRIYGWIREEHLDIKPFTDKGRKFLLLAQKELCKVKSYRAPRDKIICVLNCCKVIFGFLRNAQSDQSADAFIPILIYTVLRANPDHLVSNVQYILRFRNQDKLTGEAGYYMSSLMGAVQFIENLDRTNLTISDEDFEKNVEAAVSEIAERHEKEEKRQSSQPQFNGKSAPSLPEVTPRHSSEGEKSTARRPSTRLENSGDDSDDNAAVTGLLRTIQKPLSTIGRIFSDEPTSAQNIAEKPPSTPQRRLSPAQANAAVQSTRSSLLLAPTAASAQDVTKHDMQQEAAARQASAEAAEAQRITRAEFKTVVDTLSGMFPDLDQDVISDVVRVKEGRIGLAVDACLALSR